MCSQTLPTSAVLPFLSSYRRSLALVFTTSQGSYPDLAVCCLLIPQPRPLTVLPFWPQAHYRRKGFGKYVDMASQEDRMMLRRV